MVFALVYAAVDVGYQCLYFKLLAYNNMPMNEYIKNAIIPALIVTVAWAVLIFVPGMVGKIVFVVMRGVVYMISFIEDIEYFSVFFTRILTPGANFLTVLTWIVELLSRITRVCVFVMLFIYVLSPKSFIKKNGPAAPAPGVPLGL